ncbi:MAG: DVUA0089 family protein [Phycisphaerae bacterium]|nr:DVUA0089 family protein [Phycisphaerae bacterium]
MSRLPRIVLLFLGIGLAASLVIAAPTTRPDVSPQSPGIAMPGMSIPVRLKPTTAPAGGQKTAVGKSTTTPAIRPITAPVKPAAKPTTAPVKPVAKPAPAVPLLQVPQPYIGYLYPAGGQRGRTIEVTLGGTNLTGIAAIRVTGEGVTAKLLDNKDEAAKLSVTIGSQAELGERDLRVMTAGGASNRFRFIVGDRDEINEVEPNSDIAQAQKLPAFPVTINGQIFQADRDIFRFTAMAGQTIVADCQARRLLPYLADAVPGWFDACLTLYDAAGKVICSVDDDRFRPDPVLVCTIPKDGDYYIEVRDILYRGRSDFVYRMTIGQLPYLQRIAPIGGRRGQPADVKLFGVNLPTAMVRIDCAKAATQWIGPGEGGLPSNLLPFMVSDYDETAEAEPNDTREKAQRVSVPSLVNGRIDRPGDVDYYTFAVKAAKQKLVLEIFSRRLDSPMDSMLTVYDATGREIASNDDAADPGEPLMTHYADSKIVPVFDQPGDYVVAVRDVQRKGGPEYAYRLVIRPEQPDFRLRMSPDNPRVGAGGTTMITVDALRKDGFAGEIALSVQGLPKGFTASAVTVPQGQDQTRFTITAPATAPAGEACPTVSGVASIGGADVARSAFPAESVMQAFAYTYNIPTREFLLTVSEPPPFTMAIEGAGGVTEAPRDGTVEVKVKVVRRAGVRGGITLSTTARPPNGLTIRPASVIAADADTGTLTITVAKTAPAGLKYVMVVAGALRSGKETLTTVAPAFVVQVVEAK